MARQGDEFKPGQKVTASGLYEARHDDELHHYDPEARYQRLTCIAGDTFPECKVCGYEVTFLLHETYPYVKKARFFKGPKAKLATSQSRPATLLPPPPSRNGNH